MSPRTVLTIAMRAVVMKDPWRGHEGTGGDTGGQKWRCGGTTEFQLTHELFIMDHLHCRPARCTSTHTTSPPVAMNRRLDGASVTVCDQQQSSKYKNVVILPVDHSA